MLRHACVAVLILAGICSAQETLKTPAGNGAFEWQDAKLQASGTAKGAKFKFAAAAVNRTNGPWGWADFCINAFDKDNQPLKAAGGQCLLVLAASNWAPGASLNFNTTFDKIRLEGGAKKPVTVGRIEIGFLDGGRDPANVRVFRAPCAQLWPIAVQRMRQAGFQPRFTPNFSEKDGGSASFEPRSLLHAGSWTGTNGGLDLRAFTRAPGQDSWTGFRIEMASLHARSESTGCRAEIRLQFKGNKAGGDFDVDSNLGLERALLGDIRGDLEKK